MYIVNKRYHFYSAHRNQNLSDKCHNLHGHVYRVKFTFKFDENGSNGATLIFGDIDNTIEPLIKKLDHTTLVGTKDEQLLRAIGANKDVFGDVVYVPFEVTSVENMCKFLFDTIRETEIGVHLYSVSIKETESSEVIYSKE